MAPRKKPAWERVLDRIIVDPLTDCWVFQGAKIGKMGYGVACFDGPRNMVAHKIVWLHFKGDVPEGLELDHTCRNPPCVNPDHLEPLTHRENCLRGFGVHAINARKTHCKHGHEFTDENTLIHHGGRSCRACARKRKLNARDAFAENAS